MGLGLLSCGKYLLPALCVYTHNADAVYVLCVALVRPAWAIQPYRVNHLGLGSVIRAVRSRPCEAPSPPGGGKPLFLQFVKDDQQITHVSRQRHRPEENAVGVI